MIYYGIEIFHTIMISYLQGTIQYFGEAFVVVNVSGVGYKAFVNTDTLTEVGKKDVSCELFIYTHVRESSFDLYGFLTYDHLQFFEMLLGVSGVGPKMAMLICGAAPLAALQQSLHNGESDMFRSVPGVGKRTAERIIIELRDKVPRLTLGVASKEGASFDTSVFEALIAMGYSQAVSREAMSKAKGKSVEEKLTSALQYLGKQS